MKYKILLSLILVFTIQLIFAQDFRWKVEIPKVDSSGYYNIFLRPEITAKLNKKFSDIRIFEQQDNEVPYIRQSEEDEFKTAESTELKIMQNEHKIAKKYTMALIHNSQKLEFENFVLVIKQTDAEKWLHLSGSDDLKNWHILKNNTRYQSEFSDSATAEIRILDMPKTDYEYYKLLIFDYNKEVINLEKVISYKTIDKEKEYTEVMQPSFFQNDTTEETKTLLKINFTEMQYIDKIVFEISNPKHYLRKAELTKNDTATGKKIRIDYHDSKQQDFYLCSDSTNELTLSKYTAKELFLVVENNDDINLTFSNVKAYQENEYLTVFLEKGKRYYINFGNKNVPAPIYDMKFFRNKIPANKPTLNVSEITKLIDDKNKTGGSIFIKPFFLWIAFGIVIVILALISVKVFRKNNE